jgi:multisubunit Na+/H+ antiporter MnhE subunit
MRPRVAGALFAVLLWLAWWVAMFAFYLALVDTRQYPELVLGSIVAAAGASAAVAIRSARPLRASLPPGLLRLLPAVLWSLVSQSVLVLGFLAGRLAGRRRRGHFRTAPFRGGGDGPRDVGRRALTEGLGSLGPNTIVVGIDRERDLIVVHQLTRRDDQVDPLGLG